MGCTETSVLNLNSHKTKREDARNEIMGIGKRGRRKDPKAGKLRTGQSSASGERREQERRLKEGGGGQFPLRPDQMGGGAGEKSCKHKFVERGVTT